nr:hypothetical protein [Xenorhabdus mauleonii]
MTATDVHAYNKQETDNLIQPVKVQAEDAMKLAEKKVPLTRKINGKELIDDVELTATDVHAYNKQETDNLIQPVKMQAEDAMKLAETAKQSAEDAVKLAEKKVPLTRKINGKELVNDVELTAADIHAYNKQETDNLIQPVKVQAEDAMKLAETANSNATTGIDTATKAINEMKAAIAGKVPLTRKINGKELTNDIELTASDLHVYTTEEVDGFIDDVRNLAHEANNNANGRVPMGRKVNGKALSSDIELAASDIGTYTKTEIDIKVDNVEAKAKEANNNANSRVPMERTVNGKALLSDIKLVASDVGAYTRTEVDTRINKVEVLASNANGNANGRLEKNQNGADIPDKQAFVRNIGLGDLVGLDITSSLIGVEHTIVRLGEIFMINGLIKDTKAIAKFNISEIGGVTYYTNFYQITLPMTLPNGIISCHASIVGDNFDNQKPGILADVKTQRNNANGMGLSKDTLTISVTTPHLDWIPYFYYQVVGY